MFAGGSDCVDLEDGDIFEWHKPLYRWTTSKIKVQAFILQCPTFCNRGIGFIAALRSANEPRNWIAIRPTKGAPNLGKHSDWSLPMADPDVSFP